MTFKYQKPYALIELSEADSETHVILSNEHYQFKDVRFYTDADAQGFKNHTWEKES